MFQGKLILIVFLCWTGFLFSQKSAGVLDSFIRPAGKDTITAPDEFVYLLDHMLSNWMISKAAKIPCEPTKLVPVVSDTVITHRLRLMPCVMEMPFNHHVRSFIDMYTIKRRKQVSYLQGLGDYYFRIFEEILEMNKLPHELKYLPIIESALNATAVSRMGAAGLWQFMPGTAKMYGMEVNSLVDERMDIYKSTHAAAKYLKDMFDIYQDWHLVIAAYNCGPGNVNKAIQRAGGKRDYWAVYPFLPAETRGYVPIFIAANYAMHYANAHGICKAEVSFPKSVDTVMVGRRMHIHQIAAVLKLPEEQLRLLNPQYRTGIIPGDIRPFPVSLPMNMTGKFIDKFSDILNYKADSLVNNRRATVVVADASVKTTIRSSSSNIITHSVKKGQTLSTIAAKYGVSVSKIRQWNKMSGSNLQIGQKLKIHK